jgi:isopenicillin-N epimerase
MNGTRFIEQPIPFPVKSHEETVETFWRGVTPRTKVIHISHIAVYNALIYPVEEICRRARQAGIFTFVDGAHAPGQIPLDLDAIGADVYLGACHKWMCSPKGAGFAYVRPEVQDRVVEHLAIPRGWVDEQTHQHTSSYPQDGSAYVNSFQYQGTSEPAAYLSVPAAIDFMQSHDWEAQRERCHDLAHQTRQRVNALTGLPPVSPDSTLYYSMMSSFYIPKEIQTKLCEELARRNIVYVLMGHNDHLLMRISYQAYNSQQDADRLIETIEDVLSGKVK